MNTAITGRRPGGVRFWLRQAWRWSWIITLPIVLIFAVWAEATFKRYWTFGIRYDTKPLTTRLWRVGVMEFQHLLRQLELAVPPLVNAPRTSLRTIDVFLPEAEEARLDARLPHSGGEYVEGRLVYPDGRAHKVSVKYRGDFVWHWGYYKKSLRVKTKKKRLYNDLRAFNLIAPKQPEQLNSFLGYRLAQELGLLTPHVELVNVRMNGELRGVHLLAEQPQELMLRRRRRMPGDLYSGELIGKDAYRGINDQVFHHPGTWQKMAVNNHVAEDLRKPLEMLLHLITAPQSDAVQAELLGLLDLDAWGRFSALETLLQSFHYDNVHNWRLYFDPARSVFEPVVWDPLGWLVEWRPRRGMTAQLDIIPSQLHEVLMKNYKFLHARQQALEEFFTSGSDRLFLQEVDRAIDSMQGAVEMDPNIVVNYRVISPRQARAAMGELRAEIERVFRAVREAYLGSEGAIRYAVSSEDASVGVSIDRRRPVRQLRLRYGERIADFRSLRLRYWRGGEPEEVDVTAATSVRGGELVLDLPLFAQFTPVEGPQKDLRAKRLKVEPAYYQLLVDGSPGSNQLVELLVDHEGKRPVRAERVAGLTRQGFTEAYAVLEPQPFRTPEVWQDEVRIEEVLRIHGDLVIRPGTTVHLKPGASLVVYGQLLAQGEEDRPIRFIPAKSGQSPWGVVALQGRGASGSRLSFCELTGGSGLEGDLFEYSGMLSIHDVDDVRVSNCRFHDSRLVDDMVHAVYSSVTFSDCTFEGAFADALDLDICTAVIERCAFHESGNDALDLMTSEVVVRDTLLRASADKGISVGERSHLFAFNDRMAGNVIGVQSKDASVAVLYNVDLQGNQKALDAYKKNWQYGTGGKIRLYKGHVAENMELFTADEDSHIWVYDSYVEGRLSELKQVTIDATVDAVRPRAARWGTLWRHPEEKAEPPMLSDYWAAVDPKRRGATRLDY